MREFYAAYVATILQALLKGKKPFEQPRLQDVLVRGWRVDISEKVIHCVQFGSMYRAPSSTAEFDRRLNQLRTIMIAKNTVQQTEVLDGLPAISLSVV